MTDNEIERLKDYNENLLAANVALSCDLLDEIKRARTEAIKEFAERLKEHYPHSYSIVKRIDCIAQEMTEEE